MNFHSIKKKNKFFYFVVAFLIKHFSDTVEYDSFGFLEKNRDTVSKELVNVLQESSLDLCRKLMQLEDDDHSKDKVQQSTAGGRVLISASKPLVSFISFISTFFC